MSKIPTMRYYLDSPAGREEEGSIPSHELMQLVGRLAAEHPELGGGLELRLDGLAAGASGWYFRVFHPGL